MKVAVLGAGIQGVATAMNLAWNEHMTEIMIADCEPERAKRVADLCNKRYGNKVIPKQIDVNEHEALVDLIKDYDLVINVVNYYFNVLVMKACLEAGKNYMDLGGLYVMAEKQYALNDEFEKAGLFAITGIGGAAGVTNICSGWAVEQLDTVEEIHFYNSCNDWSETTKPFDVSYAIETIMDEFRSAPIQFIDGEYKELPPGAGTEMVQYPEPIGQQLSHYVIHSELGTVPISFRNRGLKECTFSIGFQKDFLDKLELLHGLGFSGAEPINVDGVEVKPIRVLKRIIDLLPEDRNAVINDCDVIKTVVIGMKGGERVEYTLESVCRPIKEWPELSGSQVYTGGSSAWVAELFRRGLVTRKGVCGPELAVPAEEFFKEAAKREIYITASKRFLLGSDDWDAVARKKKINQWGE